jgi:hypothetical protein
MNLEEHNERDREGDTEKDGVYPGTRSEAGEILLGASTTPQDADEARGEFTGDVIHYQTINPEVTQAIRVVK